MITISKFLLSRIGATAIEYALIGTLISVAIIGGASVLGNNVGSTFNNVSALVN